MMKHILFILGSEMYTENQIQEAIKIAGNGGFAEVFVPTPDGSSPLSGKLPFNPPLTTFKCKTMIVPVSILSKVKEFHRASFKGITITFCDLIDTWRCELNRVAAADAGYQSDILKAGKKVRKFVPTYDYTAKK